jgi:hypothetical protein
MNDCGLAEIEVENEDIILRRAAKKYQIDEDGNIKWEAFRLRGHLRETALSVVIEKLSTRQEAQIDPDKFELFQIVATVPRSKLLGVFHSPTHDVEAHGSIAGFFTEEKQRELALAATIY